jgi:hypothetical protein
MKVQKQTSLKDNLQEFLAKTQLALSLVFSKGGDKMKNLVMLMAINILEGRYDYQQVPKRLKTRVLEQLKLSGKTINEQGELVDFKG